MNYTEFIKSKKFTVKSNGFTPKRKNAKLFDWQQAVVQWACKKGRSAIFADCGLGKTAIQIEFGAEVASDTKRPVLIVAPLAVSTQTILEAEKFNRRVTLARSQEDVGDCGVYITNYEMLGHFDGAAFGGVILDESSILKQYSGKIRGQITEMFRTTPYKLECTATPAPNDYMEFGSHAEFLDIMTRPEMLATFFVHDGSDTSKWRLKGHAEENFWMWMSQWALTIKTPADIGYDASGYQLPPLNIVEHIVPSEAGELEDGQLMLVPRAAATLNERRQARRDSLENRCELAAGLLNDEQWLIWCDLNDESALLTKLTGGVEVKGADKPEHKTTAMQGFSAGNVRVLISKPSIAGWGMNWQNCHNMIFAGHSDSYEMMYQAIRRCLRYGQEHQVNVHIITSEAEGAVRENIRRKERQADRMYEKTAQYSRASLESEVENAHREKDNYKAEEEMRLPKWLIAA